MLGIEPTANTAQVALDKGIPTRVEFWGAETARAVAAETQADLLLGNNVLAHVPDINDFVAGMKIALKPGGTITMEFPHLLSSSSSSTSGTRSTTSTSRTCRSPPLERVFAAHGLRLFDVEELPTHGGSLRIFGCHADDPRPPSAAAGELLERERAAGLERAADLPRLTARASGPTSARSSRSSSTLKREGLSIAGYGAAAKGNTLLNYCGVGRDFIDFTCDANPHKQGNVLPGTHIPILAPDAIRERRPDVVLILPWNIKDEIMERAVLHPGVGRAVRGALAGAAAVRVIGRVRLVPTPLAGAYVVELDLLGDERGWFARTYDEALFDEHGLERVGVQANASFNAAPRHAARAALPGRPRTPRPSS